MYEALEHWKEYQKQKQTNKVFKTITILIIVSSLSSCYTIQEMSGNNKVNNLRCTHVSR